MDAFFSIMNFSIEKKCCLCLIKQIKKINGMINLKEMLMLIN